MPVICAVCQTENRDAAMFCHGCARKLPGFAATGPSLLDGMRAKQPTGDSVFSGHRTGHPSQNASRGFWIGLGTLMLAMALGFGGWFGYVTRKIPAPAPSVAPVAVTPLQQLQQAPRPLPPLEKPEPSEPVPLASTLGAGEAAVAANPPEPQTGTATAPVPAPAAIQRRQAPASALPATPPRAAALDPRQGCQNLNFFAAARCEAAHCDQPAYARHRRCDAVREDRRRDEARRNPTLGT